MKKLKKKKKKNKKSFFCLLLFKFWRCHDGYIDQSLWMSLLRAPDKQKSVDTFLFSNEYLQHMFSWQNKKNISFGVRQTCLTWSYEFHFIIFDVYEWQTV